MNTYVLTRFDAFAGSESEKLYAPYEYQFTSMLKVWTELANWSQRDYSGKPDRIFKMNYDGIDFSQFQEEGPKQGNYIRIQSYKRFMFWFNLQEKELIVNWRGDTWKIFVQEVQ